MEDVQPTLIPTLSKAKISRRLSYPIGATEISVTLRGSEQFAALKLHFYSGFDHGLRRSHYEFLRIEYLHNSLPSEQWPISRLCKRPPQYRWEIVVQPVPRVFRHRIKRHIMEVALPKIEDWLKERAHLVQRGSDILAFFYDEKSEELVPRTLTHLEPLRAG